ncbi:unnamed protein product [Peronospora belbahrii]|uniref:FYVE zinc finger domain-containing protein n=1 Tax=Peronospora belbahrii TaxID=622444 RepID=A0AAU9LBJ5_9STRA|nr:unnamed protein product [Peronospora belbahrii]CAH0517510.1 unnamed protein product [Peronospora belbahrii]
MGSPSLCDMCGKKFKVFGIKKKCKNCMDVVCKACLPTHLELKHTRRNGKFRRPTSRDIFDVMGNDEQEEVQFRSPVSSLDLKLEGVETDGPEDVDSIEVVSDEDDDGDLYDDDAEHDAEDDELLVTTRSRQPLIENIETQYRELCLIQEAVATWAKKEKLAKQEMRRKKYECSMIPTFLDVCDYDNCNILKPVSYAVTATVVVWLLFGLVLVIYLQVRNLPINYR